MSDNIFGSLDVDDIPDDPYFTDEGVYDAVVTRAETTTTRAGLDKIVFEYTLDDYEPDEGEEDYSGNTVSEWHDHYPHITKSELSSMDPKERKKVIQALSRVKNRIKHLGFDPDNPEFTLKDTIDTEVRVGVRVSESDKEGFEGRKFSNVRYVGLREDEE